MVIYALKFANWVVYLNVFILTLCTGDQEKSSVAYCSNKHHNFANIGHKNMNDASF